MSQERPPVVVALVVVLAVGVVVVSVLGFRWAVSARRPATPTMVVANPAPTSAARSAPSCPTALGPSPDLPPLVKGVEIRVKVRGTGHGQRLVVDGETNLPDGTSSFITIAEPGDFNPWSRSTDPVIRGGRFAICVEGLPDADYRVEVTVRSPTAQPPHVRKVIGENGERLHGKLVRRDRGTVTTELVSDFVIGDDKKAAAAMALARRTARRDAMLAAIRSIRGLVSIGRAKKRELTQACIANLRAGHDATIAATKPLDGFPAATPGLFNVRAAAGEARGCFSCGVPGDALTDCNRAEKELRDAEGEIAAAKLK